MDGFYSEPGLMSDDMLMAVAAAIKGTALVTMIIGLVGCLFGFKLTKIFMGICAFLIGFGAGIALNIKFDQPILVLVGLVLGIVLAVLSYKFFKVGVFLKTTFDALPVGLGVMGFAFFRNLLPENLSADNLEALDSIDLEKASQALVYTLIGSVIFALAIAVIAVIFTKPAIISITSLSFGPVAGISLGILIGQSNLCLILAPVFIAVGFAFQIMTNHGFLESKKEKPAVAAAGAAAETSAPSPAAEAAPAEDRAEEPAETAENTKSEEAASEAAEEVKISDEKSPEINEADAQTSEDSSPEIK